MNHTSTVHQRPERLPFSSLQYLVLPSVGVAILVALRPSKPWRLAGLVLYIYWTFAGTKFATPDGFQDYATGCALGGGCLVAFYDLVLTDPVIEWTHNSEPHTALASMTFLKRVYWVLCAACNNRGIGWSFQVPYIPPLPSLDRYQFLKRRARQLLWNLFLVDVAQTYQRLNPLFSLKGDEAKSLWSQGYVLGCLNILGHLTVSWGMLNINYNTLSLVCVASGLSEPQNWPDTFGKWNDAYTVRRFWSRTWHQWLRRYTASTGKAAARLLSCKPGTYLSSRVQLVFGFTASAFSHIPGDMMVDPRYAGSSLQFFYWQVIGISIEDFVVDIGKYCGVKETPWTYPIGWLWTFLWFSFSAAKFIDWTFPAGAGKRELFEFSVVRPALDHVSVLCGKDIVGYLTPGI